MRQTQRGAQLSGQADQAEAVDGQPTGQLGRRADRQFVHY
jgi:hypothetical protein